MKKFDILDGENKNYEEFTIDVLKELEKMFLSIYNIDISDIKKIHNAISEEGSKIYNDYVNCTDKVKKHILEQKNDKISSCIFFWEMLSQLYCGDCDGIGEISQLQPHSCEPGFYHSPEYIEFECGECN